MIAEISSGAIVVSGGSRGLGLVFVRHLLGRGCSVAAFARHETEEIRALAADPRLCFQSLDGRDLGAVDRLLDLAQERFGSIQGLINKRGRGTGSATGSPVAGGHRRPPGDQPAGADSAHSQRGAANAAQPQRRADRHRLLDLRIPRICRPDRLLRRQGSPGRFHPISGPGGRRPEHPGQRHRPRGFFLSEMSSVLSPDQVEIIRRRTPTERSIRAEDVLPLLDLLLFCDVNLTGQILTVDGGISI